MSNPTISFRSFETFISPDSFLTRENGEKCYVWEHIFPTEDEKNAAWEAAYAKRRFFTKIPEPYHLPRLEPYRHYYDNGSYIWKSFGPMYAVLCYPEFPPKPELEAWLARRDEKRRLEAEEERVEREKGVSFYEPFMKRTLVGMGIPYKQKLRELGLICPGTDHIVRYSFARHCALNPALDVVEFESSKTS
ncbi:hypothetical protein BJ508DRAFT_359933 [Ascobolus immersus RN42]|uniref:Uncharacterized protein n=1 Tax=Ascobolus immersus RN42 TaxID=1160509 RepID=A0A3N4IJB7_ASCIM|nr:hypothetical protein BJ508DRAFT_359933 [Ascobolus immersus RN42]